MHYCSVKRSRDGMTITGEDQETYTYSSSPSADHKYGSMIRLISLQVFHSPSYPTPINIPLEPNADLYWAVVLQRHSAIVYHWLSLAWKLTGFAAATTPPGGTCKCFIVNVSSLSNSPFRHHSRLPLPDVLRETVRGPERQWSIYSDCTNHTHNSSVIRMPVSSHLLMCSSLNRIFSSRNITNSLQFACPLFDQRKRESMQKEESRRGWKFNAFRDEFSRHCCFSSFSFRVHCLFFKSFNLVVHSPQLRLVVSAAECAPAVI